MEVENAVWAYRYQPETIADLIATPAMKATISKIIAEGTIPNLLFIGKPGVGKTTIAKLLCRLLNADSLMIPASIKGNIDTLRNEMMQFASSVGFSGKRKVIILDEGDNLNAQSTQPALRNAIDMYQPNCSFFLTANYGNKIIEPLKERFETHTFTITKQELPALAMAFCTRAEFILNDNGIPYDKQVLAKFIINLAPNWRGILNKLQKYAREQGEIDLGILGQSGSASFKELLKATEAKDFTLIRKWIAENTDSVNVDAYSTLTKEMIPLLTNHSISNAIIIAARYQYQAAFVVDQEINFAACMAEMMSECLFA